MSDALGVYNAGDRGVFFGERVALFAGAMAT